VTTFPWRTMGYILGPALGKRRQEKSSNDLSQTRH